MIFGIKCCWDCCIETGDWAKHCPNCGKHLKKWTEAYETVKAKKWGTEDLLAEARKDEDEAEGKRIRSSVTFQACAETGKKIDAVLAIKINEICEERIHNATEMERETWRKDVEATNILNEQLGTRLHNVLETIKLKKGDKN